MYKRHIRLSFAVVIFAFLLGIAAKCRYSLLAETAITVIAIELAVYISIPTALLGSPFSKSLKRLADREKPTKSMLGVLATYLKTAGTCSVFTIALSAAYILKPDTTMLQRMMGDNYAAFFQIVSAFSLAVFVYNIFLMCLIMRILITAMLNAANLE